jgi:Protein of unknown function (DUF4242)
VRGGGITLVGAAYEQEGRLPYGPFVEALEPAGGLGAPIGLRAVFGAAATAHQRDVDTQDKYGVKYLKYWFDPATCTNFCLIDAPSKEAATQVHREAHGLLADEIFAVTEG